VTTEKSSRGACALYVYQESHLVWRVAIEESKCTLTELQFTILDCVADDYEDLEQLYLCANREFEEQRKANIHYPHMLLQLRFPLRDMVTEIRNMLHEGLIEVKSSNDKDLAPLCSIDFTALHHYWFGATVRRTQAWKAYSGDKSEKT
jgi:hypothetical protein